MGERGMRFHSSKKHGQRNILAADLSPNSVFLKVPLHSPDRNVPLFPWNGKCSSRLWQHISREMDPGHAVRPLWSEISVAGINVSGPPAISPADYFCTAGSKENKIPHLPYFVFWYAGFFNITWIIITNVKAVKFRHPVYVESDLHFWNKRKNNKRTEWWSRGSRWKDKQTKPRSISN